MQMPRIYIYYCRLF